MRGVYHYNLLRQDDCARSFVTGSHKWPSALLLVDSDWAAQEGAPVSFVTASEGWTALDRTCIREGERGARVEIWATVIGQVRARDGCLEPGPAECMVGGYGHLGVFLAEVVVERISDVVVKPNPESRYDYRLRKPIAY